MGEHIEDHSGAHCSSRGYCMLARMDDHISYPLWQLSKVQG